jgi:hypothetical protein
MQADVIHANALRGQSRDVGARDRVQLRRKLDAFDANERKMRSEQQRSSLARSQIDEDKITKIDVERGQCAGKDPRRRRRVFRTPLDLVARNRQFGRLVGPVRLDAEVTIEGAIENKVVRPTD